MLIQGMVPSCQIGGDFPILISGSDHNNPNPGEIGANMLLTKPGTSQKLVDMDLKYQAYKTRID